jgi:hypothetical protein
MGVIGNDKRETIRDVIMSGGYLSETCVCCETRGSAFDAFLKAWNSENILTFNTHLYSTPQFCSLLIRPTESTVRQELFISLQKRITHVNGYRMRVKVQEWRSIRLEIGRTDRRATWCLDVIYDIDIFSWSVYSRRHHVNNLISARRWGARQMNFSYRSESRSRKTLLPEINDDNNGNEDHNGEAVGYR